MRHVLAVFELSTPEIERIFELSRDLKAKLARGIREPLLPGRVVALLFDKPSLRTRVSFEAAIIHLGGGSMFLGTDVGFGQRESVADFARVLSEYVDAIVVRTYKHQTVLDLAEHSTCSVINGLTDLSHPCQALADLYTLQERYGKLAGGKLVWVGDGNNVARSLATGAARLGMKFVAAIPPGYEFDAAFLARIKTQVPGADVTVVHDPFEAVRGAMSIYTDVWTSMGQEAEREQREQDFAAYQVNAKLMAAAPKDACFMHCLPACRGQEVTDEVIDGPQSVVVAQAGNRLHVQKGILAWLLGPSNGAKN
ncbi:MAG: ornithine carbamoyltransferase [Planctomycetia bacterium]|nr:ornithine carbamoyltransferase [Planctomycetia bacterium]